MDLNQLLHRHQLSLMQLERATDPEERRAHSQFARDYAEKIRMARNGQGAPSPLRAPPDDTEPGQERAMPKTRKIESQEERSERLKKVAQDTHDADAQEDKSLDAMVRKSINLYGA